MKDFPKELPELPETEKPETKPLPPARYLGRAKSVRFGRGDHLTPGKILQPGTQLFTTTTSVRDHLVESFALIVGWEHADTIVCALDAYLELEPADRVPAFFQLAPNPRAELDQALKERDEAIARAEKAEAAAKQDTEKTKKTRRVAKS